MDHPYNSQPDSAFWRRAIGDRAPDEIGGWYTKRFALDGKVIATAGSCFAQHIGRQLRDAGFAYVDKEPPPAGLPAEEHLDWGYSMYSARYGNIYTSRQLVQLIDRAEGRFSPVEDWWEKDGGIVDPFRPTIEPEPFGSVDEMRALRKEHLEAVSEVFTTADVLVFTMGLTEAWLSKRDGACYPLCPGTAGGTYDDSLHRLQNLGSAEVRADMEEFLAKVRAINPKLEILLTVSPVSMMATATPRQVSVATVYTKSVLRAVAGELFDAHESIDYFPSYDMVTGPAARGSFYKPGMREVTAEGVDYVMRHFLAEHVPGEKPALALPLPAADPAAAQPPADAPRPAPRRAPPSGAAPQVSDEDIKCDEELLNAFGRQNGA
ncbi:GSCFA domain-containing protein [Pararhodobacter zhoushanensis]|uniref:GSCFA domain-containing protein n=1 Tax=Pararhodobacter zhoushanensis TaxID=2479545 RepID=A0ABT3H1E0_9RHOB|nr:GSCFA domain-containing protein [Pararhodobacter zhoushanensis]MCW1933627.1 GSCFA domain-containing protein [Pararhodobacter zhoushanensis]